MSPPTKAIEPQKKRIEINAIPLEFFADFGRVKLTMNRVPPASTAMQMAVNPRVASI